MKTLRNCRETEKAGTSVSVPASVSVRDDC